MKKMIRKIVLKIIALGMILLFSLPAHAGWVQQLTLCAHPDGGMVFVIECDAWGGHCSDQHCGCGGESQDM